MSRECCGLRRVERCGFGEQRQSVTGDCMRRMWYGFGEQRKRVFKSGEGKQQRGDFEWWLYDLSSDAEMFKIIIVILRHV